MTSRHSLAFPATQGGADLSKPHPGAEEIFSCEPRRGNIATLTFRLSHAVNALDLAGLSLSGTPQVWLLPLNDSAHDLQQLCNSLSPEEQARAGKFLVDEPRRNFIVCRAALRRLLAEQLACPPAEVRFTYSATGKPLLEPARNRTPLHFNVAHSGDLAVVAIAENQRVGVDVERVRPETDLLEVARSCCSPQESMLLASVVPEKRLEAFYRVWTRKESLLKATGAGITAGLKQTVVAEALAELEIPGPRAMCASDGEWQIVNLPTPRDYVGALTLEVPK